MFPNYSLESYDKSFNELFANHFLVPTNILLRTMNLLQTTPSLSFPRSKESEKSS